VYLDRTSAAITAPDSQRPYDIVANYIIMGEVWFFGLGLIHGKRGERAYNGGLGSIPQRGPGGCPGAESLVGDQFC